LSPMIAVPAARSAAVWPSPHDVPASEERQMLRDSLTIVDTAAIWSASKACRNPSMNPKPSAADSVSYVKSLSVFATPLSASSFYRCAVRNERLNPLGAFDLLDFPDASNLLHMKLLNLIAVLVNVLDGNLSLDG
jgi:hypothetical protein